MSNSSKKNNKDSSILYNQTSYITSEKYHALNRNGSEVYILKSTSTLFYDLDTLAKRHSYHFVPEYPISEKNTSKENFAKSQKNVFGAKSEAIVQEFETQIKPKLKRLDSLKITSKKLRRKSLDETLLSSEIFLRDNDYTTHISDSLGQKRHDLNQKFWSYAKYQTQYTNPIPETKKSKKKDRGKRTEDPCPCQLFSYACPCTEKKSLTELAKNSKSLTVADQITSTPNFSPQVDQNHRHSKTKKSACSSYHEDKPTNTNYTGFQNKNEINAVYEESLPDKKIVPKIIENKDQTNSPPGKNGIKIENKPHKKSKQVICPNCKEILEIFNTDDDVSLNSNNCIDKQKTNNVDETDICIHDPPCELVPVCQILPSENITYNNTNQKCVNRVSLTRHNPKIIRITKACRHHPPCIVVPSCQRLNVLKNNCEFVPPCLHRPRCVNVPLCIPHSKNLNYEDILNRKIDGIDPSECAFFCPRKITSANKREPVHNSNSICEYFNESSPRFMLSPQKPGLSPALSPYHEPNLAPCVCCKSNKSCQYNCVDTKCDNIKECASSEDIVYIRDVGCQFKSDMYTQNISLMHSKTSSNSFDLTSAKGKYYSNYHTLRYEDKYTNPISGEEASFSTLTTSSLEIDAHCPAHGIRAVKKQGTGFTPRSIMSPLVAAFTTYKDPILQHQDIISDEMSCETIKSGSIDVLTYLTMLPVKTRRSFLKGKRKKMISIRRRNNSKRYKALKSNSKIKRNN